MMSPVLAKHLGVNTGDLINIAVTEKVARRMRRTRIHPAGAGHCALRFRPGTRITRSRFLSATAARRRDRSAKRRVLTAISCATAPTRTSSQSTARLWRRSKSRKCLGDYPLSITQDHWSIEGRGLVREASIENYREDPEFVKKIAGDDHLPAKLPSLYSHPPLTADQQWGMCVDLECLHRLQRVHCRLPERE